MKIMTIMMHTVEILTARLLCFTVVVVTKDDCCADEHAISYDEIYECSTSGSFNLNADSIMSDYSLIDAGDCCAYSIIAASYLKVE